jgi:hypothetical protein
MSGSGVFDRATEVFDRATGLVSNGWNKGWSTLPSEGRRVFDPVSFQAVGFRHRNKTRLDVLEAKILTLEPEPDNKADANAIKLMGDGIHLGYVAREYCRFLRACVGWEIKAQEPVGPGRTVLCTAYPPPLKHKTSNFSFVPMRRPPPKEVEVMPTP